MGLRSQPIMESAEVL